MSLLRQLEKSGKIESAPRAAAAEHSRRIVPADADLPAECPRCRGRIWYSYLSIGIPLLCAECEPPTPGRPVKVRKIADEIDGELVLLDREEALELWAEQRLAAGGELPEQPLPESPDEVEIDFDAPLPDPCPSCGRMQPWWDVAERQRCMQCDPPWEPGKGAELRAAAAERREHVVLGRRAGGHGGRRPF